VLGKLIMILNLMYIEQIRHLNIFLNLLF